MKKYFILIILVFTFSIFTKTFADCWDKDEVSEVEGFSEVGEQIVLSFKDPAGCLPIENADITLESNTYKTDARGYLKLPLKMFENIEDKEMMLIVKKSGYTELKTILKVMSGTVWNKRFLMLKDTTSAKVEIPVITPVVNEVVVKVVFEQPQPPVQEPVAPPALPVEGVFFEEKFSKYAVGDPVPEYGANLLILQPNVKIDFGSNIVGQPNVNYIGTNRDGEFWIVKKVPFTKNFLFEFEFPNNIGKFPLIFIDKNMDEFKIYMSTGNSMGHEIYITLPNTKQVTVKREKRNFFKLVKKDNVYKIYVNGEYVTSGEFKYDQFTEFKLRVGDTKVFFTNFKGTGLN